MNKVTEIIFAGENPQELEAKVNTLLEEMRNQCIKEGMGRWTNFKIQLGSLSCNDKIIQPIIFWPIPAKEFPDILLIGYKAISRDKELIISDPDFLTIDFEEEIGPENQVLHISNIVFAGENAVQAVLYLKEIPDGAIIYYDENLDQKTEQPNLKIDLEDSGNKKSNEDEKTANISIGRIEEFFLEEQEESPCWLAKYL